MSQTLLSHSLSEMFTCRKPPPPSLLVLKLPYFYYICPETHHNSRAFTLCHSVSLLHSLPPRLSLGPWSVPLTADPATHSLILLKYLPTDFLPGYSIIGPPTPLQTLALAPYLWGPFWTPYLAYWSHFTASFSALNTHLLSTSASIIPVHRLVQAQSHLMWKRETWVFTNKLIERVVHTYVYTPSIPIYSSNHYNLIFTHPTTYHSSIKIALSVFNNGPQITLLTNVSKALSYLISSWFLLPIITLCLFLPSFSLEARRPCFLPYLSGHTFSGSVVGLLSGVLSLQVDVPEGSVLGHPLTLNFSLNNQMSSCFKYPLVRCRFPHLYIEVRPLC